MTKEHQLAPKQSASVMEK